MVTGDSHTKRIKRYLFNNSFKTAKIYIKSFSRAKTQDLRHHITPLLAEKI